MEKKDPVAYFAIAREETPDTLIKFYQLPNKKGEPAYAPESNEEVMEYARWFVEKKIKPGWGGNWIIYILPR